jgi:hypothetical protein
MKARDSGEILGPGALCSRQLLKGDRVDRHHWRPTSWGGKEA